MLNELNYLFPSAIPDIDFMLQDDSDGNGVYIKAWNTGKLGVQPTAEQLAAVSVVANAPTKTELIKKIDADVDAIYGDAVGNRSLEYTTAEEQAQAYKDAAYAGTVPPFVASWVTASGLTAQAAADNILAQAVAWRGAVAVIRAQRLQAKANVTANVPTAMAQWGGFVAVIRGQLGL